MCLGGEGVGREGERRVRPCALGEEGGKKGRRNVLGREGRSGEEGGKEEERGCAWEGRLW